MPVKVFITGVTGYVGGDFLYLVSEKHPEWKITALVRNSDKGAKVAAVYPQIRLVYGDLDAVDLIEEEASTADIVYHFASADHAPSAEAISRGLARRDSASGPGYYIHTSGTGVLTHDTVSQNKFGEHFDKVYDDGDNIGELTHLPDEALHRGIDKIVLASGSDNLKTAIVCPPTIYGLGRGPDNRRSMQVYMAIEAFMKHKRGFQVGAGQNIWGYVHVQDLSKLYLLLGEAAVNDGHPATWNDQGYYLAEAGSFVWGELLSKAAEMAYKKGFLPSPEADHLSPAEVDELTPYGSYLVGTTSRGTSIRAKKLLGWQPTMSSIWMSSIWDELPSAVDSEAKRLGLVPAHKDTVEA